MMKPYNLQEIDIVYDTKKSNKISYVIIILLLIEIFIILYKFNFRVYSKYTFIKQDNSYVSVIDSREISSLEESKHLYINNKKYKYKILKVDSELTNINGVIFQSIYITPINYSSNANILECFIIKSNETIIDTIIKFIRGGF